jgi:predicted transposase YdaD
LVSHLLEGVLDMQESTTYQAILREGRNEGLIEGRITGERQVLIRQGTKKFGTPDAAILAAIETIRDLEKLEAVADRLLDQSLHDRRGLLQTA